MDRNGTAGEEKSAPVGVRRSMVCMAARGLAVGAVVYGATCGIVTLALSRPKRVPFEETPERYGLSFEPVLFRSQVDRIPLDGWLLHAATDTRPRRPVVMVHGMGGDRQHEAGGCALHIAAGLVQQGHPVLMFDLRGSGRSGGSRFTLGAQEVRDVGGAIDFLEVRGLASRGVNLLGYSMGAATAVLAGAADPRVRAVAEDSGYAELDDLLKVQLPRMAGLPSFFAPGVVLAARLLLRVDLGSVRPIDAAPRLAARDIPFLLLHGEGDTMVPCDHGRRLATAYGPKAETLFVPGAEHVGSFATNPSGYMSKLTTFFSNAQ